MISDHVLEVHHGVTRCSSKLHGEVYAAMQRNAIAETLT